ncbi:glycoside hydrolase family 3 N-terminal domain-containing protein [Kordia algicida OT-1]|uniref:beta-N-acetylhexosaminidase n=1 Tax=Kordia algicida OT-1 TaxID=391587 RepID=A9E2K6_9FLAO|nr:glycoside hydrolase family 3 N-terminal domain-containing protein [Kordia algicida]EDP95401.1 b-N-acetylglucosaminidase, glycoside hydrolase family 3 protein [Kordia algicida OT-1]
MKLKIGIIAITLLFVWNTGFSQTKKTDSLDIKIGQMLMLGIGKDTEIRSDNKILADIKAQKLGGVLIYEKNITKLNSVENLKRLISKLKKHAKLPLLVSIDEEGGKVNRLKQKYGFPKTVSAKYLGEVNDIDSTKYYSDIIAHNLLQLGINVNYAPVLDVHNDNNPPIGKNHRAFSKNPQDIINHARQVVLSHRYFNVKTVVKHFPGHGNSRQDSHYNVTDVSKYWQQQEVFPYIKLLYEGNVDAIMTAHIVNEKLDDSKLPATLSKKIMTDYLRGDLGFDGVIFSDDMQMKAIADQFGFEKSIQMAIHAGVDVLMFSNHIPMKGRDMILPQDIIDIVKKMIADGEISEKRIDESYQRILKFKKGL